MARKQEPMGVNRGVVWVGAAGIIAAMLFAWGIAVRVAHVRVNGPLAAPASPGGAAPRFGVLEQEPFDTINAGDEMERAQQAALRTYRWADLDHTSAQIPVAQAEALLLARRGAVRPNGGSDGGR